MSETVEDLENREGHGTSAYWDSLTNLASNEDARDHMEVVEMMELEEEEG